MSVCKLYISQKHVDVFPLQRSLQVTLICVAVRLSIVDHGGKAGISYPSDWSFTAAS